MIKRSVCLVKQISLLEIASAVVLLAALVADLSGVFHAVDSAALQVPHRCTPAPDGMPAVPAALPTHGMSWSQCHSDERCLPVFLTWMRSHVATNS